VVLGPTVLNIWAIPWLTQSDPARYSFGRNYFQDPGRPWRCGADVYRRRRDGPHHDAADGRARVLGGDRRSSPANGGRLFPVAELRIHSGRAIFIGTILTATSVTITAQSLINLGQLKSKIGSTILGAAVIDDVLGLIVLSVVIALAPLMAHTGLASWSGLSITLGRMVVCLAVIGLLGRSLPIGR